MRTLLVVAAVVASRIAFADPTPLGDAGESCRVRADCRSDLHCIDEVCTSVNRGTGVGFSLADGRVHPFFGWTMTAGVTVVGETGTGPGFAGPNGAFGTAFDFGMFVSSNQVTMSIGQGVLVIPGQPVSLPNPTFLSGSTEGVLDMVVSYASLVRLGLVGSTRFYWPVRVGVGMLIAPAGLNLPGSTTPAGAPFVELHADVIGLMIQAGHVFVDLHLPTFTYALTPFGSGPPIIAHIFDWEAGATLGYAF